jgi:hypothetical protein
VSYIWIGRKLRHAHAPVGNDVGNIFFSDEGSCIVCGYRICCETGPCAPTPPPPKDELPESLPRYETCTRCGGRPEWMVSPGLCFDVYECNRNLKAKAETELRPGWSVADDYWSKPTFVIDGHSGHSVFESAALPGQWMSTAAGPDAFFATCEEAMQETERLTAAERGLK